MAHLLWGMANFYDSVDLALLATELIKRDFPAPLLVLGFLTHAARRMLRVGKGFGNSVVAGCQISTDWARGLPCELLQCLAIVDPSNPCHEHVDDLSHVLVAESES